MLSWLKLGRAAASADKPRLPLAAPGSAALTKATTAITATTATPAATAGTAAVTVTVTPSDSARPLAGLEGLGLRRPLVGRDGRVAGFELVLAPAVERRLAGRADTPSAQLYHRVLVAAAAAVAEAGRSPLLRLPGAALALPSQAAALPAGAWVVVSDGLASVPAPLAAALRARGVQLGAPDGPPQAEPVPDFVHLQAGAAGVDTLQLSAQRWRDVLPQVRLVCTGLLHLEDLEQLLQAGVDLASGELGRSREALPPRALGAAALRIAALLNDLAQDRDTAAIADAVRGDATLTYRLLRYANSPAIGLRRAVEAVDDAVQLLGRAELRRWLAVQLAASAPGRTAGRALEESALARGRTLEALARLLGDPNPGAHFTLGVLSLIEPLLQVPLAQALGPLRLGAEFQAALLRRSGPWAPRLALLEAWDRGDDALVADLNAAWGLSAEATARVVDEAWAWSAELEGP